MNTFYDGLIGCLQILGQPRVLYPLFEDSILCSCAEAYVFVFPDPRSFQNIWCSVKALFFFFFLSHRVVQRNVP